MGMFDDAFCLQIFRNLEYLHRRQDELLAQQQGLALLRRARRERVRRAYRRKQMWVRPWTTAARRLAFGHWDNLLRELRMEDTDSFHNYFRMAPEMFDEIHERVRESITKQDTNFRSALPSGLKLAVTLRHLASGDKYPTLSFNFRIGRHTISSFLPKVCQAIIDAFVDEVMDCPTDADRWREIEAVFRERWNVPHACGALDGKHVAIKKPDKSGSLFRNYKQFFSIVLMALVDADYKFIWADVGGVGHQSDAQLYNDSDLKECLEDGTLDLPEAEPLPNDDQDMPYFFLGDDAFALRTNMMKPFSRRGLTEEHRVYNYRISRGRRVVENAFGILANRWQVLMTTMQQSPRVVRTLINTTICLHNLMRLRYPREQNAVLDAEDNQHNLVQGAWRQDANRHEVENIRGGNRDTLAAKKQRESLRLYFSSDAGSVPWQLDMI